MKIAIESTNEITMLDGRPARRWKGVTERGIECELFITGIAVRRDADSAQFRDELLEMDREPLFWVATVPTTVPTTEHHVAGPLDPDPPEKYERLPIDTDLSATGVNEALTKLGVVIAETPVLHVAATGYGPEGAWPHFDWQLAVGLALRYGFRVVIDLEITDSDEWFIEYGGRCVGSPGV